MHANIILLLRGLLAVPERIIKTSRRMLFALGLGLVRVLRRRILHSRLAKARIGGRVLNVAIRADHEFFSLLSLTLLEVHGTRR